jgi:hypothetical protein
MDLKDWMLVVGAGLVMAVLIDAARRVQLQRRNHIRMNAKVRRDTDNDDEPFNLLSELPNGGARIVRRDDLQQETAPTGGAGGDGDAGRRRRVARWAMVDCYRARVF